MYLNQEINCKHIVFSLNFIKEFIFNLNLSLNNYLRFILLYKDLRLDFIYYSKISQKAFIDSGTGVPILRGL